MLYQNDFLEINMGLLIIFRSTNMEEAALRVFSQLSPAQMLAIHEDTAHTLESLNDPMGKIFEKMMKKQVGMSTPLIIEYIHWLLGSDLSS